MKKLILIVLLMFPISGFTDNLPHIDEFQHGDKTIYIICFGGVQYYMFNWGLSGTMAPRYYQDGELYTCNESEDIE